MKGLASCIHNNYIVLRQNIVVVTEMVFCRRLSPKLHAARSTTVMHLQPPEYGKHQTFHSTFNRQQDVPFYQLSGWKCALLSFLLLAVSMTQIFRPPLRGRTVLGSGMSQVHNILKFDSIALIMLLLFTAYSPSTAPDICGRRRTRTRRRRDMRWRPLPASRTTRAGITIQWE